MNILIIVATVCSLYNTVNKTGLQPVSRPVERVHYLGGGVGVQSPFDAIAVQTVTLLAMHV